MTNGAVITTTDYAGKSIYQNNALQFISQPEGYIEPDGQGGYDYTYQYKDHLGNIRLSYKDISTTSIPVLQILEENNYYPFGLKHSGYNMLVFSANLALKYKFNGKELQDDLIGSNSLDWYDYGARFYDASLGRWHAIDPMTFLSFEKTPYHFVGNNTINRVDLFGLTDYNVNGQIRTINDGNDDVEINVTNRQFRRLQKKFNRSNSSYNSYMNKLSSKNGYKTIGTYFDGFSMTGIGVEIIDHKPGGASYSNLSQGITTNCVDENAMLDPTLNYLSKANGGLAAATSARAVLEWEYISQARINRALSGNFSQTVKHSMRAIKAVGKFTGVASMGISWSDYANNPTKGNLIQAIANTGLVFVRVNPITGIIIGVADVTGASDYVYDQIGGFIDDF